MSNGLCIRWRYKAEPQSIRSLYGAYAMKKCEMELGSDKWRRGLVG